MKEKYYSAKTIDEQAKEFCEKLRVFREKHPIKIYPEKAALLVIDMQDFFAVQESHAFVPSMLAIIPRIKKLQDLFLAKGLTVIQTWHGNTNEDAGQMYKWWQSMLASNDPLVKIIEELQDSRVEIIHKTRYDAFWNTDLDVKLKRHEIGQIIVTGVMAHLCCETTARAAFVRDFEVFFGVDTTATYNKEFHLSTLTNLAHGFAIPILAEEIAAAIE